MRGGEKSAVELLVSKETVEVAQKNFVGATGQKRAALGSPSCLNIAGFLEDEKKLPHRNGIETGTLADKMRGQGLTFFQGEKG